MNITFPQGRVSNTAKVRYGHRDYKLQRSSKYGNCCVDCAHVLEFAPGLYERNYRITKPLTVVKGNDREVHTTDWWPTMIAKVGLNDDLFNPAWLHSDRGKVVSRMSPENAERYIKNWSSGMERVSLELVNSQHRVNINRSKFLTPPEINVQGAFSKKKEESRIVDAIRTLKDLVQLFDSEQGDRPTRPAAPDLTKIDFIIVLYCIIWLR